MARLMAHSALALAVLAAAPAARAGECRPVHGFYTSQVESPPGEPLRTAGELVGGLQGEYAFVQTGALPAAAIGGDPGLLFYVGTSVVTLRSGDLLYAADSGVIDVDPLGTGKQAALLVVTGGTGAHEAASGFLQLRGTLDLASGEVTGDYDGEVCTP